MKHDLFKRLGDKFDKVFFTEEYNRKRALKAEEYCKEGNLVEFKKHYDKTNPRTVYKELLRVSCWASQNEMYEYLLTLDEIRQDSDAQKQCNSDFQAACARDNIELIKYFYSDKFPGKKTLNIYEDNNAALRYASDNACENVVKFFLFDEPCKTEPGIMKILKMQNRPWLTALIEKKELEEGLAKSQTNLTELAHKSFSHKI